MQQEGMASVPLPQPASHLHASLPPCVEAPLRESTVLVAAGCSPRVPLELLCWEGVERGKGGAAG